MADATGAADTSIVIPAYNEAAAIGAVVRDLLDVRRMARNPRHRRRIDRRHRRSGGGRGRPGDQASLQQGQRRRGEDRHPARQRRARADHRRRRAARAGRRDQARLAPGSVRSRRRRAIRSIAGNHGPASGQLAAERHRQLPDRTADPRSHVGLPRGPARLPARVPAPAAERILDTHDHDAGVHEGRLQRAVRAGRGRTAARSSRRSGSAPTACRSF